MPSRKIRNIGFVSLLFLAMLYQGCDRDPFGFEARFREFEQNWIECYENKFVFPRNPYINGTEYLQCKLDGREVLLNDQTSGFEADVRFEYGWITGVPNIDLSVPGTSRNRLRITFLAKDYWRHMTLVVQYPNDSLNRTIQQLFDHEEIECSGNFVDDGIYFELGALCGEGLEIIFSTVYSEATGQSITIDSFNYKYHSGRWFYHLEYSFDEMQITNSRWNSRSKVNSLGEPVQSDSLIENLLLNDMKCVIKFDLPED